jgi:hypothetical protein
MSVLEFIGNAFRVVLGLAMLVLVVAKVTLDLTGPSKQELQQRAFERNREMSEKWKRLEKEREERRKAEEQERQRREMWRGLSELKFGPDGQVLPPRRTWQQQRREQEREGKREKAPVPGEK